MDEYWQSMKGSYCPALASGESLSDPHGFYGLHIMDVTNEILIFEFPYLLVHNF